MQRLEGQGEAQRITYEVMQLVVAYQASRYLLPPRRLRTTFLASIFIMKLRRRMAERRYRAQGHADPHGAAYGDLAEQAMYDFAAAGTITAAQAAFLPDRFYGGGIDWGSWEDRV